MKGAMQMSRILLALIATLFVVPGSPALLSIEAHAQTSEPEYTFHDSHFHLTNYVQEGTDIQDYLAIMGETVGRSTLFGIPLQQTWSYANTGDFAPTYYLHSDAPLYYYSFTDAYIAQVYNSLAAADQARFDPMIPGSILRICTRRTIFDASS